jgi:hypothetical protein
VGRASLYGGQVHEVAPNLWRWTAPHPDWHPAQPGSSGDWEREVGCVLYCEPAEATFIDPLLPPGQQTFLERADRLVARRAVAVLTTVRWHSRSRRELVRRYRASVSRSRRALSPSIVPLRIPRAQETIFWLPEVGALIPGDRIIGDRGGGVRVCPQSWLGYLPSKLTVAELTAALRPLLELPVELVLVSHGEPVLSDGREALRAALAAR